MKTIQLTRGMQTLVDDEDFPDLSQHKWYAQACPAGRKGKRKVTYYAARRDVVTRKIILMHREILGLEAKADRGDHRNGDSLNNQRYNLRRATHSQNLHNTGKRNQITSSQYKGVSYYKTRKRWEAYLEINGKRR